VVIPEPSWWEPETPFLYRGILELWDAGQATDRTEIIHGFCTYRLGSRGLFMNGKPFTLRAADLKGPVADVDLRSLRAGGCNCLVFPLDDYDLALAEAADRLGFLVLGRLAASDAGGFGSNLETHPSLLGYLGEPGTSNASVLLRPVPGRSPPLYGLEVNQPINSLPHEVGFLICPQPLALLLAPLARPTIIRPALKSEAGRWPLPEAPPILGLMVDPESFLGKDSAALGQGASS
jgi:hypothetical protein